MVRRWLHRDPSDSSGLTFVEWDPVKDADPDLPPVPMMVNSSEVRGAGFKLKELMPAQLDRSVRVSPRLHGGAGVRTMEGVGEKRLILDTNEDNTIREFCE